MPYTFLILSAVVALAYAGLCIALFVFQRSFIYFPKSQSPNASQNRFALPVDGASVIVTTRSHSSLNAVVYFGGNAEDVSLRMPSLSTAFPNYAIYLLHYRGYGGSSGKPSEAALFADALALFDKVYTKHQNIVVVGRSLGSGVAVHLASLRPVTRLVLVTPYDSIQELAARQFPYIPVRWLLVDKFESWKYAKLVNAPTLIIAAEHDEVIPRASTESLFACFRIGVASFKVVLGTSHNTIYDSIDYLPLLGRWELT